MKKYIKKHFITLITAIASIVASVYLNFTTQISIFENIILALIILLITSQIFEYNNYLDKIEDKITDLNNILPESRVITYNSVEKMAQNLGQLISIGDHSIDFVSLDKKHRTPIAKSRKSMTNFVNKCLTSKNIKFRYIISLNSNNIETIIHNIIETKVNEHNSFFAIYQNVSISFASFFIIDKKYLSIRTPYHNGMLPRYCLIYDKQICDLFISWFKTLWDESTKIDSTNDLKEMLEPYKSELDNIKFNEIVKQVEDLKDLKGD